MREMAERLVGSSHISGWLWVGGEERRGHNLLKFQILKLAVAFLGDSRLIVSIHLNHSFLSNNERGLIDTKKAQTKILKIGMVMNGEYYEKGQYAIKK